MFFFSGIDKDLILLRGSRGNSAEVAGTEMLRFRLPPGRSAGISIGPVSDLDSMVTLPLEPIRGARPCRQG